MRRDLKELAARFRSAIVDDAAHRQADEAMRAAQLAQAREARQTLLDELVDFAELVGIASRREAEDVVLERLGRGIRFAPAGDGDGVAVTWTDMGARQARLYREAALGERWVLSVVKGRGDDRLPLVDQGMTWLMVEALGLPGPSQEASKVEPAVQPSRVGPVRPKGPQDDAAGPVDAPATGPDEAPPRRRL